MHVGERGGREGNATKRGSAHVSSPMHLLFPAEGALTHCYIEKQDGNIDCTSLAVLFVLELYAGVPLPYCYCYDVTGSAERRSFPPPDRSGQPVKVRF
jgi:hypothetical protein